MDKTLLESLEAMAAALTTVGGEARQILADHPLTDKEAAEAEKEGLTHLEYRLAHEVFLRDEFYSEWAADWHEAEAVVTGRKRANKKRRAEIKAAGGVPRKTIRDFMVAGMMEDLDAFAELKAIILKITSKDQSMFRGDLSKTKLKEAVHRKKDATNKR